MAAVPHKLGALLMQAGLLGGEQLHAVLRSQLFFGGRFGTNVVEAELATLDAVAAALALQHGVPAAPPQALLGAPPEALRLVPASLCARYRVFPLRVADKLLHLAMMDPRDLQVADELAFTLGLRIRPYVVPELRLLYHLERAFGIPRDARYLRLSDREQPDPQRRSYLSASSAAGARAPQTAAAAGRAAPATPTAPDAADELVFLDSFTSSARPAPAPAASAAPVGEALRAPLPVPEPPEPVWSEGTDVPMDFEDEPLARRPFDEALAAIDGAASRDEVIDAVVAAELVPDALQVLFVIRGQMAAALSAVGGAAQPDEVRRLAVSLASGTTLRAAFAERAVVAGPAREDPVQYVIASVLRAPAPAETCAAPICIGERVVNLLCLQVPVGATIPQAAVARLGQLCERAAAAYLRLIRELKK